MPRTWPNILGLVNPGPDGVDSLHSQLGMLPGWVVFYRSMARDVQVYSGDDFRSFSDADVGVICCLEWDDSEGGTLPAPGLIKPFLQRCQSYVEASTGCHVWVIGNEMNAVAKWPLSIRRSESIEPEENSLVVLEPRYRKDRYPLLFQSREAEIQEGHFPISPSYYVDCYIQARECIKALPGHEQDLVLVGAVAPWNTDAKDPENPSGDWIRYFKAIASALQGGQCEGFAMHTATLGPDPELLPSDLRLPFPFGSHMAGFRGFEDFIAAIPEQHRRMPVFLTEASQLQPWLDANDGWVFKACTLINDYNRNQTQSPIRCLALFQWGPASPWSMRGKSYLLSDIRDTLQMLADRTLKATLCKVDWDHVVAPERIAVGEEFEIAVTFSNNAEMILHCSGDDPVRFALAFRPDRNETWDVMPGPELRFPLSKNVEIGGQLDLQLHVQAPRIQGEYQLFLGIVKSQFVWTSTELEGAFIGNVSILDPIVMESLLNESEPDDGTGADTLELSDQVIPASAETDSDKLTEVPPVSNESESLHDQIGTGEAVQEREAIKEDVAAGTTPMEFDIIDLTAFIPLGTETSPSRLPAALNRIVFAETGLTADTPLDAYLDHFRHLGLEDLPIHFVLENEGPIFQVLSLDAAPLTYSQNLAQALVLGLEGRAMSQIEAKKKLLWAAKVCATILHSQVPFGLSLTWEIGMDSLDGEIPFCGLAQEYLMEVEVAMQEQWEQLGKGYGPLTLNTIDLPLESPLGVGFSTDKEGESESLVKGSTDSAEGSGVHVEQSLTELEIENVPLHSYTLTSTDSNEPVDLESAAAEALGLAYKEKESVTLWAAGEQGNVPVSQLRRIHGLQYGDIVFHFVITTDGKVFETRRGFKPDEKLPMPFKEALHVGLLGDFTSQYPTENQTRSCSLLLARLASGQNQSGEIDSPSSQNVSIGTEKWYSKEDWIQRLLLSSSQLQDQLKAGGKARNDSKVVGDSSEVLPLAGDGDSLVQANALNDGDQGQFAQVGKIASPSHSEKVPRIVNKIGVLPTHPRMQKTKRQLESIRAICIHHTDAPGIVGPEQLSQSLILDQSNSDLPLHGLPYHFFVHADGQIDQCLALEEVCQSISSNNEHLISIGLAGKFTGKVNPTMEQLKKTGALVSWLMKEHFLAMDNVRGHKDIDDSETVCPGDEWSQGKSWKETLFHYID